MLKKHFLLLPMLNIVAKYFCVNSDTFSSFQTSWMNRILEKKIICSILNVLLSFLINLMFPYWIEAFFSLKKSTLFFLKENFYLLNLSDLSKPANQIRACYSSIKPSTFAFQWCVQYTEMSSELWSVGVLSEAVTICVLVNWVVSSPVLFSPTCKLFGLQ